MKKQISTANAPAAVGPYSQAIDSEKTIYISGQLPIDHATGKMCEGSIYECARLALLNLEGIINEAGGHMGNIVKVTVFLTDIADFPTVNSVYEAFFPSPYPARSAFAVAALPLGGKLEIEAIAVLD